MNSKMTKELSLEEVAKAITLLPEGKVVATLALARDQDKGVASVRAYK
jgi:hypothetical protein